MARGSKSSYTSKQKRRARHIEEGYESRGISKGESERRAWATINKISGGGKKSGSGRGRSDDESPARKGGRKGGRASARTPRTTSRKRTSARGGTRARARTRTSR